MLQTFPRILLVDMNSFFASVEQQANPFLRGKVVGVCASLHETSCLIATSREAKKLGIKTGMLTYKAKKIYPKIILLQAEPEKYREVNRRIVKIFCDYTDLVEVYSIDEAFLDLYNANDAKSYANNTNRFVDSHKVRSFALSSLHAAIEIKQRIRREVGEWLTCSVGIAPNKFMAKLAADMQKPDGLSIIWRENLPEIYKSKQLKDLWGISSGWSKRLGKIGITSPLQLLNYPVQNLISLFGKPGYYLWQRVNGLEEDHVSHLPAGQAGNTYHVSDDPKSFGHSWVLNFRTTDKERLKPVILRLAEKAARRMRAEDFQAYGFYLSVRMVDGSFMAKSKKLKFAINTGLELYEQAMILWKDWIFHVHVMHIAVGFRELVARSCQLELFDNVEDQDPSPWNKGRLGGVRGKAIVLTPPAPSYSKRGKLLSNANRKTLTDSLDYINNKYGEFTIRSGLLTKTVDYAPDAIAFGK